MYSETQLAILSETVRSKLSEKRFRHTRGVEDEITRMGTVYLPDRISDLRAAALLHDVAKEMGTEEQIEICRKSGDPELDEAIRSPAILHGHAAAYLIPDSYPEFNLPEIISSIYKHTTGAEEMSIFDKLLFLADFIEPNREWNRCRETRKAFWDAMPRDPAARIRHLDLTVLSVLEFTVSYLYERGIVPDPATERAANALRQTYPNQ